MTEINEEVMQEIIDVLDEELWKIYSIKQQGG